MEAAEAQNIVVEGDLALRAAPGKGRGVFALRRFAQLERLLVNPVLVFEAEALAAFQPTPMNRYLFHWPFGPDGADLGGDSPNGALAFGLLSLVNHEGRATANATWVCQAADMTISAFALRDIEPGEEVVWDYWGALAAPA